MGLGIAPSVEPALGLGQRGPPAALSQCQCSRGLSRFVGVCGSRRTPSPVGLAVNIARHAAQSRPSSRRARRASTWSRPWACTEGGDTVAAAQHGGIGVVETHSVFLQVGIRWCSTPPTPVFTPPTLPSHLWGHFAENGPHISTCGGNRRTGGRGGGGGGGGSGGGGAAVGLHLSRFRCCWLSSRPLEIPPPTCTITSRQLRLSTSDEAGAPTCHAPRLCDGSSA